jgi:hypothetical protein
LLANLGAPGAGLADGDLTGDAAVDLADVARLQDVFGRDCEIPLAPPAPPTLITPADGGIVEGPTALLSVEVSDVNNDVLDVRFYGRRVIPNTAETTTTSSRSTRGVWTSFLCTWSGTRPRMRRS